MKRLRFLDKLGMTAGAVIVMADFLYMPTDPEAARRYLQQLLISPTTLSSSQIADTWSPEVRAAAMFSATTARDDALEELRQEILATMNVLTPIDGVVSGNDLASARLRFQNWLADNGWERPEGVEPGSIADLSSARRIDLIINTKVQQAYAVGDYRQQQTQEARALYPYLRYVADPRPTRRPDHWRLNGLILPKDHLFWRGHTGPWDYNCFCTVEELSQDEAEAEGIGQAAVEGDRAIVTFSGGTFEVLAPASGYSFDPALGLTEEA
jgi:hypothetical protein